VLTVHEVRDLPSGDLVLVTEFCSGGTLRRHLSQVESMPARDVLQMGSQLLVGLRHIHKAGLFHADLKPENIFRARTIKSPQWKIADFGLARREGEAVEGISLTPAYAAPEQYLGHPCKASDIYSVAVVLAEAFTGRRPRRGRHRELVESVDDAKLREFCLSCIDIEPATRPGADAALLFLMDFGSSDRIRRHLSDSAMSHARNLLNSFAGTA
jgi:serine/threonine protein kinase